MILHDKQQKCCRFS